MGLTTFLSPILSGTVKDTTGTTAGTIRNVGPVVCVQSAAMTYSNTTGSKKTVAVLPAGSKINRVYLDVTTAFNAGTNNVVTIQTSGGTVIGTVTNTDGNMVVGRYTEGGPAAGVTGGFIYTGTSSATIVNVGTSDVILQAVYSSTGTAASTGAATVSVEYTVRNPDGTFAPVVAET